jgi:hypothetical protein
MGGDGFVRERRGGEDDQRRGKEDGELHQYASL